MTICNIFRKSIVVGTMIHTLFSGIVFAGAFSALKIEIADEKGFTNLVHAIKKGEDSTAKNLIEKGVNINKSSQSGISPLMMAAYKGNNSIIELLIQAGAILDNTTKYKHTALSIAAIQDNWDAVNLLLDSGSSVLIVPSDKSNDDPPLISAISHNKVDIVKKLLDKGASLDVKDLYRSTPLEISVSFGKDKIVSLLLENGADPNVAFKKSWYDNRSAIWHARKNGHTSTVKLLEDIVRKKKK